MFAPSSDARVALVVVRIKPKTGLKSRMVGQGQYYSMTVFYTLTQDIGNYERGKNDLHFRNVNDRRMDGRTDGRTDIARYKVAYSRLNIYFHLGKYEILVHKKTRTKNNNERRMRDCQRTHRVFTGVAFWYLLSMTQNRGCH